MMTNLRSFRRNESGSSHERLAIVAAVITVASIVGAHYLDRLSQAGGLPRIAIIAPDGSATTIGGAFAALPRSGRAPGAADGHFGDIDYSATGSLPADSSRPLILDPCTGRTK